MRWGCEISFRYLKHANGLLYFHSKKPEFLKQEIYANLILYNFGIFLANEVAEESQKKKRNPDNKYNYEIDFSSALKTARKFFIRRDSHKPVNIIRLMSMPSKLNSGSSAGLFAELVPSTSDTGDFLYKI